MKRSAVQQGCGINTPPQPGSVGRQRHGAKAYFSCKFSSFGKQVFYFISLTLFNVRSDLAFPNQLILTAGRC